jgi:excisionase family DNA binding protein
LKPILTPKELALAIGVSESSLKRWADDGVIQASRTAGGHRRIPIAEALRFIRQNGCPLIRPEVLGLTDVAAVAGDVVAAGSEADRLYAYLEAGRATEARGFILSLYLSGQSVAEVCDGPIREAMSRLGALWTHKQEGIYIEHRATDICIQALNQLRLSLPLVEDGPVAVGCAPENDLYLLPTMAAATVLASEGFRAVNLGPQTPLDSLVKAVEAHGACLSWISVSMVDDGQSLRTAIEAAARTLAAMGCHLVVGGQQSERLHLNGQSPLQVLPSMRELAEAGRKLLPLS